MKVKAAPCGRPQTRGSLQKMGAPLVRVVTSGTGGARGLQSQQKEENEQKSTKSEIDTVETVKLRAGPRRRSRAVRSARLCGRASSQTEKNST